MSLKYPKLEGLIVLRRKAKEAEPQRSKIVEVYKWSSMLTAESHPIIEDYYWTKTAKRILFKLRNMEAGLIGIVGLQGTGKSALIQVLACKLHSEETPTEWLCWTKEAIKNYKLERIRMTKGYHESIYEESLFAALRGDIKLPPDISRYALEEHRVNLSRAENLLSRAKVKEILEESVIWELATKTKYLFIDLPDYSKGSRSAMNKDLSGIETLWKTMLARCEGRSPIIVLGIQKEMAMKNPHFFLGKFDLVELKPLEPDQLVEAYQQKWHDTNPFTEDSLYLLAELSRGVFRRFLKYIQLTIEEFATAKQEEPITAEFVRNTITFEQILKDMDLELSDIFKKREDKAFTVKILNYLREVEAANYKTIAESLSVTEKRLARFMEKLEAHGYVKRQRGKRKEIICCLT